MLKGVGAYLAFVFLLTLFSAQHVYVEMQLDSKKKPLKSSWCMSCFLGHYCTYYCSCIFTGGFKWRQYTYSICPFRAILLLYTVPQHPAYLFYSHSLGNDARCYDLQVKLMFASEPGNLVCFQDYLNRILRRLRLRVTALRLLLLRVAAFHLLRLRAATFHLRIIKSGSVSILRFSRIHCEQGESDCRIDLRPSGRCDRHLS